MTTNTTEVQPATQSDLRQRAAQFDDVLMQHACDRHNIVRANLWMDPLRCLSAGDIDEPHPLVANITTEDLYAYEDSGMTTGAYLASQSIRYRVTGEEQALENANRAFSGIQYIYHLGIAQKTGFFPKPYGAKFSEHFSRDQYLFAMSGLTEFYQITSPTNQTIIRDMLKRMAEYWISIEYCTGYFGLPKACHLDDFMGSLFLGIIGIAAKMTDSDELKREYDRLYNDRQLGKRMPETLTAQYREGKTYDGGMYLRQSENAIMMKAMAIDYLWNSDPDHRDIWAKSLDTFWNDDLLLPLNRETGLNYFTVKYDPQNHQASVVEPGVIEELENPLKLSLLTWGGSRQTAGSTQTAFAAAIIASRNKHPEAGQIVELVLNKLSLKGFRGLTVPDARHIPSGHEFETKLLNSGYLAYWLWTYWLARDRAIVS